MPPLPPAMPAMRTASATPVTSRTGRTARAHAGRAALLTALATLLGGCEKPVLRWIDAAPLATTQPSPLAHPAALAALDSSQSDTTALAAFLHTQDLLREAGAETLVRAHLDSTPESREQLARPSSAMPMAAMPPAPVTMLGDANEPLDPARCARSLRTAVSPERGRIAVWWSRRDRGRVMLVAAWRDGDTGGWRGPIMVDTLDQGPGDAQAGERGSVGCARSAPSVTVDDTHGYVHVAYALVGPEGPGVFYAHQMDPRAQFEAPKAVVYGTKIGAARIATAGDVVAVAYEDPNSGARPRIGLAVSTTSGHLFAEHLIASADNANARDPWVAAKGRAVVVGWSDIPAAGGDTTFRIRRARVER